MKLARYDAGQGPRLGLVEKGGIIDLANAGVAYESMKVLIADGDRALESIAKLQGNTPDHSVEDVRLMAPVPNPGKFLAIGMNYLDHREESSKLGVEAPERQLWFNKQTSCIAGPYDEVARGVTEKLDYEVELGLVIGRPAKRVAANRALEHVFGYLVVNDVSARDWQFHSPTFTMGKSFDTHGPIGPWIVTADEIARPDNLDLTCSVNGEVRQSANTSYLIHGIEAQIEYLSTAFTLESGDLLATGTPAGVGVGMDPPVFLQPGDEVRCEIENIGAIQNRIVA